MELPWLELSNALHVAEEMKLPLPSSKTVFWAAVFGVPIAVLLHDTSDRWMPSSFNIPIVSWFQRKWCQDPQQKKTHLRLARNAIIFSWMVCALGEGDVKIAPLDYVTDRIANSNARKSMTNEIYQSRRAAFGASQTLIGESALDEANARQQRDAALRRRHSQELRRGSK